MAAEIRDLEDQLYEYDYEYRQLEQELASLRAEQSRLQMSPSNGGASSLPAQGGYPGNGNSQTQPLEFFPRGAPAIVPEPTTMPEEVPAESSSILEGQPSLPPTADRASDGATSQPSDPVENAPNNLRQSPFRSTPDSNDSFDLDIPEELLPPAIESGTPSPPPSPVTSNSQNPGNALELNLSRVEIPAQLASQITGASTDDGAVGMPSPATVTPAIQQVTDRRVVEIAFHPSLSRAANFDNESDDDGLYLVLQPLNERGQMVAAAADLSIVVLDPSLLRDGEPASSASIGRRDFSALEVKAKMQPIGSNQGIHLSLPWNGPNPGADRVTVFVRYTFPDGRQVTGTREFMVNNEHGLKTVWAPRGGNREVAQASYSSPMGTNPVRTTPVRTANGHVVRPAVGSSATYAAPEPSGQTSSMRAIR